MPQNFPYNSEEKIALPLIHLLERTELTFSHAFFQTTRTLYSYLQDIQFFSASISGTASEPYTIAIISLFSKMIQSYYAYVLLEIHHERVSSQVLIEHLSTAAITLVYLLENPESEIFAEYVSGSICQAQVLLQKIATQLQPVANNLELALLNEWLKTFISQSEPLAPNYQPAELAADMRETQTANTTTERAASMGLNFLDNPARQMAQKVMPASWLDVRLNYFNAIRTRQPEPPKIDFEQLRDASHLCLHATKVFLEKLQLLTEKKVELSQKQQNLNRFFEWFYQAYRAYSYHENSP